MIKLNNHVITPTIFPDGTSQVWKIPVEILASKDDPNPTNVVQWTFEAEAELIHVAQLLDLVEELAGNRAALHIPYFPYARQDKDITNCSTFALESFCGLCWGLMTECIVSFDVHSRRVRDLLKAYLPEVKFWNLPATDLIASLIKQWDFNAIIYPDEGAAYRYSIPEITHVVASKVRDQETGRITSYELDWPKDLNPETTRALVVDDICDGGATFIELGKKLFSTLTIRPSLYVSHGIFSKGLDDLRLYYKHIYTTDSLPTKHKELIVYESAPPHRLLQGGPSLPVPQGDNPGVLELHPS